MSGSVSGTVSVSESRGWDQVHWEPELEGLAISQPRGYERARQAMETRFRKNLGLRHWWAWWAGINFTIEHVSCFGPYGFLPFFFFFFLVGVLSTGRGLINPGCETMDEERRWLRLFLPGEILELFLLELTGENDVIANICPPCLGLLPSKTGECSETCPWCQYPGCVF